MRREDYGRTSPSRRRRLSPVPPMRREDYGRNLTKPPQAASPVPPIIRAELLDEGLDIVTQLWTGESVHHFGRHFRADGVRFLPRPFQRPRIPIWCGARWPHQPPLRRAARYNGVVPIGDLPPEAVTELLSDARRHRTSQEPFDVAIASWTASAPAGEYEAAGATWWLEAFQPDTPLTTAQRAIEQGPTRP